MHTCFPLHSSRFFFFYLFLIFMTNHQKQFLILNSRISHINFSKEVFYNNSCDQKPLCLDSISIDQSSFRLSLTIIRIRLSFFHLYLQNLHSNLYCWNYNSILQHSGQTFCKQNIEFKIYHTPHFLSHGFNFFHQYCLYYACFVFLKQVDLFHFLVAHGLYLFDTSVLLSFLVRFSCRVCSNGLFFSFIVSLCSCA